ncbi:MAG TPA: nuclear transport factor 2 family protein [Rubrobacteraceae bacterium]|nr:nuclear transport factor 2 family protein [Rubrobacteraceae bacterium]
MKDKAVTAAEIEAVLNWHEALNDGDTGRLIALSDPEIEVGGPRGSGRGAQLLREWMERANIRLEPRRVFHRADTVVVEQEAEWRSADTGEVAGGQAGSSVFVVRDGLVASVLRYDDLADALRVAALDESNEVDRSSSGEAAGSP